MTVLLLVAIAIVLCFGLVVLRGAPYVPSLRQHMDDAFKLLDLEQGDLLVEIGAGDGRVMLAALKRGYQVVGYELNPILALIVWLRTRKYGTRARVVWGDAFRKEWPTETKAVYLFGVQSVVARVDRRLRDKRGVQFVTLGFQVVDKNATKQRGAVHLYKY